MTLWSCVIEAAACERLSAGRAAWAKKCGGECLWFELLSAGI